MVRSPTGHKNLVVLEGGGGVLKGFFYIIIENELRSFCLIQIKSGDITAVAVRRSYPDIDGAASWYKFRVDF